MSWTPAITVAAVTEADGRFLLVEELIDGELVLNQPAGHVEDGETLLEAVVRETREETGWEFTPEALLGVYGWRSPRTGRTTLRFAFTGSVAGHDPARPLDRGIVRARWLTPAEALGKGSRLRSPLVRRCIADYLGGRRLPLEAIAFHDPGD